MEFLSIFRMSSPPAQTQSSPIDDFLVAVLFCVTPNVRLQAASRVIEGFLKNLKTCYLFQTEKQPCVLDILFVFFTKFSQRLANNTFYVF